MAGEVLKALIFRPKAGESGMMVRRNGRFSLGQARGQALCIPTWTLHTKAFILIFAWQLFKPLFTNGANCSWCSFGLTLVINS